MFEETDERLHDLLLLYADEEYEPSSDLRFEIWMSEPSKRRFSS